MQNLKEKELHELDLDDDKEIIEHCERTFSTMSPEQLDKHIDTLLEILTNLKEDENPEPEDIRLIKTIGLAGMALSYFQSKHHSEK